MIKSQRVGKRTKIPNKTTLLIELKRNLQCKVHLFRDINDQYCCSDKLSILIIIQQEPIIIEIRYSLVVQFHLESAWALKRQGQIV